jgi:ribosomal protein S18 acetylase RimI-like enzyme
MQEKWQQAVFSDRLIVLVAEDSCALAGFIALKRFDVDAPLIDNLHVDPAAHGRGIGRALMQAGAARLLAEGDIGVRLIVLEGNSAARAFYARLGGLEGAHFIDDFFGTPEAALYIIWDDLSALC